MERRAGRMNPPRRFGAHPTMTSRRKLQDPPSGRSSIGGLPPAALVLPMPVQLALLTLAWLLDHGLLVAKAMAPARLVGLLP